MWGNWCFRNGLEHIDNRCDTISRPSRVWWLYRVKVIKLGELVFSGSLRST